MSGAWGYSWGSSASLSDDDDDIYWNILEAVRGRLEDAGVDGVGTPEIRELAYKLGSDVLPQCWVCPLPDGEKIHQQTMGRAGGKGRAWWDYDVLVLLISASNRALASGVQDRLRARRQVRQLLFVPTLDDVASVVNSDASPRAALDMQAALGANFAVSGFLMTYRSVEERGG